MQMADNALKIQFDSIIFDLDGTLWDSTPNVALAWDNMRNKVDYVDTPITATHVQQIAGMPYDAIFETLFPTLNAEQRSIFQTLCAQNEIDLLTAQGGILYPGFAEAITYLASKYKLYIVSNCQSGYIEIFLKHCPLAHCFLGHQCYGTKGLPKADNIKDIVADHHLQAPVYIGDTKGDRDAATKAGVPFIFAAYGFGVVENGWIARANSMVDLITLL